jgi:CRISPR/Cas system-associated endonuclease/helicase Cas3
MWNQLASNELLDKTVSALEKNGFNVTVVENREEAKEKALSLISEGSEVMTMTSATLQQTGIDSAINESGNFDAIHPKVLKMDRTIQAKEIAYLRSAPEYAMGSVHAVTSDGKVMIASRTGSQLPAYIYGSKKVIWVIGTQKLVENVENGFKRLDEYVVPLESERANKAYNMTAGSFISKLVIYYNEEIKDRIHIILVKENLGF